MGPVAIVSIAIGAILLTIGLLRASRHRARGGSVPGSRDWYVSVIIAGAGGGLLVTALVQLIRSQ